MGEGEMSDGGMALNGFMPVIDHYQGGYAEGFSSDLELEFFREGWDRPKRFRLRDQGQFYNIAGLYWREPTAASEPEPQFCEFG